MDGPRDDSNHRYYYGQVTVTHTEVPSPVEQILTQDLISKHYPILTSPPPAHSQFPLSPERMAALVIAGAFLLGDKVKKTHKKHKAAKQQRNAEAAQFDDMQAENARMAAVRQSHNGCSSNSSTRSLDHHSETGSDDAQSFDDTDLAGLPTYEEAIAQKRVRKQQLQTQAHPAQRPQAPAYSPQELPSPQHTSPQRTGTGLSHASPNHQGGGRNQPSRHEQYRRLQQQQQQQHQQQQHQQQLQLQQQQQSHQQELQYQQQHLQQQQQLHQHQLQMQQQQYQQHQQQLQQQHELHQQSQRQQQQQNLAAPQGYAQVPMQSPLPSPQI